METLLEEERGDENYEPCEDSGSFGRGGNAHGFRSRVWRRKRRGARSDGSLGRGRQELVQRERRRGGSCGKRQVILQCEWRSGQILLQRVWGTHGSEVLREAPGRPVGRPGVFA
jgi:hypothetical protein